jgi:hypothetical protein
MIGAARGFRRLKACKPLPSLRAALLAHHRRHAPEAGRNQRPRIIGTPAAFGPTSGSTQALFTEVGNRDLYPFLVAGRA